ncbi:MAG TPA: hypothetical protein VKB59_04385 [Micromonosporaceae bacterium]|nr:hypothetical protein [Micromonosporaceae bacterium]
MLARFGVGDRRIWVFLSAIKDRRTGLAVSQARLRIAATATVAAMLFVSVASCASAEPNQHHVTLSASWAVEYHSLAALKENADVAVAGKFERTIRVTKDEDGVPYTDFGFNVERVLLGPRSGSPVSAGTTLEIHQPGAASSGVITEIDDDPLFQVGDQAILFLHEYSPGKYFVIGGPGGRFSIVGGSVKPINDEGVPFSGDLSTFVSALDLAK